MINDDMCRNLSVLFYNFYEKNTSDRKEIKLYFENIVEQIYSEIFKKEYRNLMDTNLNLNQLESPPLYKEVVSSMKSCLENNRVLYEPIYTYYVKHDLNKFITRYLTPFILSILEIIDNKSCDANALFSYLKKVISNGKQ
ncbi:hypothetical protein [Pasteurella multocida]|uniref:hypothetical protein n=1 Tax=Pasteurella multocida TaxID=747 RepID=UPI000958A652|nr:hypothetical protein [Pasteurella multocida]APW57660.1 hypothetical protein BV212_05520 [Pasteurella multocida]MCL7849985.1 hypothetical protein [Pasteurella multocida]